MLPVRIAIENSFLDSTALTDSGAALSLIHWDLISKFNIPTHPCIPPIKISAVNNKPIGDGITHQTLPMQLHFGLFHQDAISFYVTESPRHNSILGYPWLSVHNPVISWHQGEFTHWSPLCWSHCLNTTVVKPCLTTSTERPDTKHSVTIPSCYQDFLEVFSKVMATKLSPNRSWDCRIDLLPNAMPAKIKSTQCQVQKHKPWKSTSRKL